MPQWADCFQNNLCKSIKLRLSIFQDPGWIRVRPIWKLLENLGVEIFSKTCWVKVTSATTKIEEADDGTKKIMETIILFICPGILI